ncbi:MAG: PEP-CTERM sorting domain-containing protein [Myxococcota bacterium]
MVPEPSTLLLVALGLAGVACVGRGRRAPLR